MILSFRAVRSRATGVPSGPAFGQLGWACAVRTREESAFPAFSASHKQLSRARDLAACHCFFTRDPHPTKNPLAEASGLSLLRNQALELHPANCLLAGAVVKVRVAPVQVDRFS